MKTKIIKCIVALMLSLLSFPMMGQDFMEVYFKDGLIKKFYLEGLKEWKVSQYDAEGVKHADYKYQHIKTNIQDFVFDLEKIDSIVFTKFDEEKVKQAFSETMEAVIPILSQSKTSEDIESHLDEIKNTEGVVDAWYDAQTIYVKIKNWETITLNLQGYIDAEEIEEDDLVDNMSSLMKSYKPQIKQTTSAKKEKPSVVVINQQHYDTNRSDRIIRYHKLLEDFAYCGFDTVYIDYPTIDFFDGPIYKYNVVIMNTHGNIQHKQHSFITGEVLGLYVKIIEKLSEEESVNVRKTLDAYLSLVAEQKYKGIATLSYSLNTEWRDESWLTKMFFLVAHPCILEDFFESAPYGGTSEGKFPENSIFFDGACHNLAEIPNSPRPYYSLGKILCDNHGLGYFFGYTALTVNSSEADGQLFRFMLTGKSMDESYSSMDNGYLTELSYGAKLLHWPLQLGDSFIVPTITLQKDDAAVKTEFFNSQVVEILGNATSLDYTALKYGFFYGTDANHMSSVECHNNDVIKFSKPLENGNGNVQFRTQLTNLELGNTYYYCAYTYDGKYYNCGDTLSFNIEKPSDLALSAREITLEARTTKTVEITSGSGYYTVSVDEPTYAAASRDGSVITIKGLKEGPAVVTVEDKVSHQTAAIKVTVNAPDPSTYMKTFTVNGVSFTMVNVEGATYYMGKDTYDYDADNNEYPRHIVSLSNYYIGQTEVTQELWTAVMGSNPSKFTDSDQLPVDRVTWEDCQDFVAKLNELTGEKFRLPTEAEWEFAARGGMKSKGYKYSGSDNIDEVAWYKGNAEEAPHPVATKAPNELGLYDMSGNARELVYDWYGNYKSGAQVNPTGPSTGTNKVERGGSWYHEAKHCRPSARYYSKPTEKFANVGFRLAQSSSDERLDGAISEENLEKIEKHMPIFDGSNPPNIEGEYLGSPWVVLYDETNYYEVGHILADEYFKFYNQDMVNNTLDFREKQATTEETGIGSFISGDGTHFTVYFDTEGVTTFDDYNITHKTALVISGTKTTSGIGNLFYGFVLLEKSDDPNHHLMEVGFCRVLKDQDGSSPYYNWYGGNAPKRVPGYDWSLPGMLWNKP